MREGTFKKFILIFTYYKGYGNNTKNNLMINSKHLCSTYFVLHTKYNLLKVFLLTLTRLICIPTLLGRYFIIIPILQTGKLRRRDLE